MKIEKMKKRVGIITLHGHYNYGNKLQNYALQETIKYLGCDVETVIICNGIKKTNKPYNITKKIKEINNLSYREICEKIYNRIENTISKKTMNYLYKRLINERIIKFKDFSSQYLSEKFFQNNDNELKLLSKKYDFFIAGSDQVWNPAHGNKLDIYFLSFAKKNQRISYAPSFGVAHIPEGMKDNYITWLTQINYLSVREKTGAKIIKELTGIDVPVLLDPTLLVSKKKWLSISKKALNRPEGEYLLTYFLGKIPNEAKKLIKDISKKHKMKVIKLADLKDKETYVTGPSEFIDYINSASIFLTDSFHGVVFSILLETPFVVYERIGASMYSRIETILDKFNLRSREAKNINNLDDILNIDFSHVPPILDEEREKALNYLKEALNIKEED